MYLFLCMCVCVCVCVFVCVGGCMNRLYSGWWWWKAIWINESMCLNVFDLTDGIDEWFFSHFISFIYSFCFLPYRHATSVLSVIWKDQDRIIIMMRWTHQLHQKLTDHDGHKIKEGIFFIHSMRFSSFFHLFLFNMINGYDHCLPVIKSSFSQSLTIEKLTSQFQQFLTCHAYKNTHFLRCNGFVWKFHFLLHTF